MVRSCGWIVLCTVNAERGAWDCLQTSVRDQVSAIRAVAGREPFLPLLASRSFDGAVMRQAPESIGAEIDLVSFRIAATPRSGRAGLPRRRRMRQGRDRNAKTPPLVSIGPRSTSDLRAVGPYQPDVVARQRLRSTGYGPQHHPSILPGFCPARHRTQQGASSPWCRRAHVRTPAHQRQTRSLRSALVPDAHHDLVFPGNGVKVRRLMVSVVHRDLDAVDDRERRHGMELYHKLRVDSGQMSWRFAIDVAVSHYSARSP